MLERMSKLRAELILRAFYGFAAGKIPIKLEAQAVKVLGEEESQRIIRQVVNKEVLRLSRRARKTMIAGLSRKAEYTKEG